MGTEADYLIDQNFDRDHGEYGDPPLTNSNYSHVIHTSCEGCKYNGQEIKQSPNCQSCVNWDFLTCGQERKNYTPVPPVTYKSYPDCAKLQKQRENLRSALEGLAIVFDNMCMRKFKDGIQKCLDEN
ncbi:MAG: hypothetical protein Q7J98_13145 [Kiritimatiellia bacterium]|nr:hypothetical protein [Kiritimatiellia bacterium]